MDIDGFNKPFKKEVVRVIDSKAEIAWKYMKETDRVRWASSYLSFMEWLQIQKSVKNE